jgi:hypothetical protein
VVRNKEFYTRIYSYILFVSYQVKATAVNVDEAVRELPDANLVRYSLCYK